jgi:hypothetical protein
MAIDRFTKDQFEAALPTRKTNGEKLWLPLGLQDGEYVYLLPINPYVSVKIRSSIDHTGLAAEVGQDSIRLWLVDPQTHKAVGPKLSKYVTRVPGWVGRLAEQLRELWTLGRRIRLCACRTPTQLYRVKAEGENKGRLFFACPNREPHQGRVFEWE